MTEHIHYHWRRVGTCTWVHVNPLRLAAPPLREALPALPGLHPPPHPQLAAGAPSPRIKSYQSCMFTTIHVHYLVRVNSTIVDGYSLFRKGKKYKVLLYISRSCTHVLQCSTKWKVGQLKASG